MPLERVGKRRALRENQEIFRVAAMPYMEGVFIRIQVFDLLLFPEILKYDSSQDLWFVY